MAAALEARLQDMTVNGPHPDVLTFAGNGEPTSHPHFAEIIDDTVKLRDKYFPEAKISVLSNSTFIHKQAVHDALMRVDNNILKLDTVNEEFIREVDRPLGHYSAQSIVEGMKAFGGHVIVQTMFLDGTTNGKSVDNTGEEFVAPWLEAVKHIAPQAVMIYTIDRETPDKGLAKASKETLDGIRDRVIAMGIPCTASY